MIYTVDAEMGAVNAIPVKNEDGSTSNKIFVNKGIASLASNNAGAEDVIPSGCSYSILESCWRSKQCSLLS